MMTHEQTVEAGKLIAMSEMFGKITAASGYMIAMICQQERISYLEFNEVYNWMHGGPSMKADAMLAKFCDLGGTYQVLERDDQSASIQVTYQSKVRIFGITWEEVKDEPFTQDKNGKTKSNYATPRKRMQSLWSRAVSDAVHTICPQACKGSYTTEEAETFVDSDPAPARTDPKPITPAQAQERAGDTQVIDYTTCPIGGDGFKGEKWDTFDDDTLTSALELDDTEITKTHKAAIRLVLNERTEGR